MDSLTENQKEASRFSDASQQITQKPDIGSEFGNWEYDVWISTPQSVRDRQKKFYSWMRLSIDAREQEQEAYPDKCDTTHNEICVLDVDRVSENGEALHRRLGGEVEFSSSTSSFSSLHTDDSDLSSSSLKFEHDPQFSGENEVDDLGDTPSTLNRLKNRWLSKLHSMMSSRLKYDSLAKIERVGICQCGKKSKDVSTFFARQDIQAHKGSILTMKFSLDGKYLASAGKDQIVRVWQVVEEEILDSDLDPSFIYFSVNHLAELSLVKIEKDKTRSKSSRSHPQSPNGIPPKKFQILENPLHEFQGHNGEILDLSWSKNNYLLSSSVDKTVRLWEVGVDQCLKVFSHSDYVTCIQFNPVDDDSFISGSIDGRVRIWTINGCQVVYWAETRDIITAVSYRPDGQGGIIGSITGTCRIFNISDDNFKLGTQFRVSRTRKPCMRITGFKFLPHEPEKAFVTCADSTIRIIDGNKVIRKYKGTRSAENQTCIACSSDRKHTNAPSDGSNAYICNHTGQVEDPTKQNSFQCFSSNASITIPWPGFENMNLDIRKFREGSIHSSSSARFSLSQDMLGTSITRSATWPEEKLLMSSPFSNSCLMGRCRSMQFEKSCKNSMKSYVWGPVIVTASWDGRIRSFQN